MLPPKWMLPVIEGEESDADKALAPLVVRVCGGREHMWSYCCCVLPVLSTVVANVHVLTIAAPYTQLGKPEKVLPFRLDLPTGLGKPACRPICHAPSV